MTPPTLQRRWRTSTASRLPTLQLRQFAYYEIDPAERAKLNLSLSDPRSWQRLTEAYFQHYPQELKKHRLADKRDPVTVDDHF